MREGSFENEVKCPEGTNPNDWISMHAVEFYNQLTLFFTMLQGNCTSESCPHMCAGPNYKFLWQDEKDYKKPTDMPAKEYISLLFDWADAKLGDIKFFPHDPKAKYPSNFKSEINKIFRRFLRVFGHIYNHHLNDLKAEDAVSPFNILFKHFYVFVREFSLIKEEEFAPLEPFIKQLGMK